MQKEWEGQGRFLETPAEIARAPTNCLGDKNYYIMVFLLAKLHTFAF